MYQRLHDSLESSVSPRTGPAVLYHLADRELDNEQARRLFEMSRAPEQLWPIIATARATGWVIDNDWMARAVQVNQVPGSLSVLREEWYPLAAATSIEQSDAAWEYMTPLIAYRLQSALSECPDTPEWGHLVHLCGQAARLLEGGHHEAAQALGSVVLTSAAEKLNEDYGDKSQKFGENARRSEAVKDHPAGRDFIREYSWVHLTADWLILPAVHPRFKRTQGWRDHGSYSRHMSIHGADNANQYRPANAARATAAAVAIVHLVTHPSTEESVRSMIRLWVAEDLAKRVTSY